MATLFTSRSALPVREKQYLTRDGDVLDALCFDHYGSYEMLFINAVLRRNPTITNQGLVIFPAGLLLVLPIITPEQAKSVRKFMEWPSAKLIGFNIPALPDNSKPKATFEVTPEKVVEALEEFRRQRVVTKIPFYEEPPNDNVGYADDPFAFDPPKGVHPPSVDAAAKSVAAKKKSLNDDLFIWWEDPIPVDPIGPFPPNPPWAPYPPKPYWYGKPSDPMNDPQDDNMSDPPGSEYNP